MNIPVPVILDARRRLLTEVVYMVSNFASGLSLQSVEIGTIRAKPGEYVHDGGATITFAGIACATGGMLATVDINPEAIEHSKVWTQEYKDNVHYVLADGREYLKTCDFPIDILYLDGPTENPKNGDCVLGFSRECLEIVLPKMAPTSLVVFDDTTPGLWEDKATGCPPLLTAAGYGPHHDFPVWVRRA